MQRARIQAQDMRRLAQHAGLDVGKKVRILRRSLDKSYNLIVRRIDNGVVTEIFPHFFIVQIGAKRECFRWNEVLGNESTKVTIL